MATSKYSMALVIILFILHLAAGQTADTTVDCGSACKYRCSLSSRPNLCNRACNTCCARCHCVPPGTSGNYETCPCYWHMTTYGGKRKCP